jgi:hypothetical protein
MNAKGEKTSRLLQLMLRSSKEAIVASAESSIRLSLIDHSGAIT